MSHYDVFYPFYGKVVNEDQMKALQTLLSVPYDAVLTTNYSYELELASMGRVLCFCVKGSTSTLYSRARAFRSQKPSLTQSQ